MDEPIHIKGRYFLLMLAAFVYIIAVISGFNSLSIFGGFVVVLLLLGFAKYLDWPVKGEDDAVTKLLALIVEFSIFIVASLIFIGAFAVMVALPAYISGIVLWGSIIFVFGFIFSILMYDFIGEISKFMIPIGVIMMVLGLFMIVMPFASRIFL